MRKRNERCIRSNTHSCADRANLQLDSSERWLQTLRRLRGSRVRKEWHMSRAAAPHKRDKPRSLHCKNIEDGMFLETTDSTHLNVPPQPCGELRNVNKFHAPNPQAARSITSNARLTFSRQALLLCLRATASFSEVRLLQCNYTKIAHLESCRYLQMTVNCSRNSL